VENLSTKSDHELIAQSLGGDSAAFGALVLRYRKMLIGVSYRVSGDATLAEDIAQDTFIRVWDRLSTFRPQGNFRAWICRIASNMTIDALRRRKPMADVENTVLEAPGDQPETAALKSERAAAVRAALMELPEHSRMALVLREYEGLSYREIADGLDIPIGTVKSRLNDARRRLKVALATYVEG
jgi:RNA polymerase sigma-70 factor (ECF subfamily)